MKVLGKITEAIRVLFRGATRTVTIDPDGTDAAPSGPNARFTLPNEAALDDELTSNTATQALTNKSLDVTTNTITGGTVNQVLTHNGTKYAGATLAIATWIVGTIADAMTYAADTEYANDGTPSCTTGTLPSAPAQGSRMRFIDVGQDWATTNLVVTRGGADTIYNGVDTTITLDVTNGTVELVYYGTNWSVVYS